MHAWSSIVQIAVRGASTARRFNGHIVVDQEAAAHRANTCPAPHQFFSLRWYSISSFSLLSWRREYLNSISRCARLDALVSRLSADGARPNGGCSECACCDAASGPVRRFAAGMGAINPLRPFMDAARAGTTLMQLSQVNWAGRRRANSVGGPASSHHPTPTSGQRAGCAGGAAGLTRRPPGARARARARALTPPPAPPTVAAGRSHRRLVSSAAGRADVASGHQG